MSAEKHTAIKKEKEDGTHRFFTAKNHFYAGEYLEAVDLLETVYDEVSGSRSINSYSAYILGLCHIELTCFEKAIEWLEIAVEHENPSAAYRLGILYESGASYTFRDGKEQVMVLKDESLALKWFITSAELGNTDALFKCSEMYRYGKGTIRNYERSFLYLLKAASYNQRYRFDLSQYFVKGIGVEENVYEAYIWALMAQNHCSEERVLQLEGILDKKMIVPAQKEAEKRVKMLNQMSLDTPKLFEYMTQEVLPKKVKPKEKTEPKTLPNPAPAPLEEEEPEPTPDIEYKYVGVCRKRFNPEKVTIELVVNVKAKKTEEMDFDSIKITYNGKHTDKKLRDVLYKKGINYKQRRLLLALAAQFSEPDPEQRFLNIRQIVQAPDMKTCVSNLNAMFRAMFPGCEKNGSFSMIDRKNGRLFPQLKVDTTKIINARNYGYWRKN